MFVFFFQTFNGNFDQSTVEKQILFSAFVARYLRFVVGSSQGGACLRVEVFGIPRSRGLISCRNCSVFKEYSFLPSCGTFLHIIDMIFFLFATTLALEPLSCSFFLKNLVKIQSLQVIHCICLSPCSLPLTTFCRKEVCNFTAKIPY